jgi:WD40 repeat protein
VRRNLPLIRVPLNGFLHAFAADADRLASKDGTHVLVHDLATRREILQRLNDEDAPDLVEEATLRLALEQLEPTRLRGHRGEPEIMRFSAHGDALVTADDGGNVLIWDVAGKPLVEELDAFVESGANAIAAVGRAEAISADGRILARAAERAVGCSGDYVLECERTTSLTLRNRTTGEVIGTLEASRRGLGAIEWSETLAVEFTAGGDVLTVGFTQDGRPTARYAWHVDPEALIERACRRANRELGRDDVEMRRYVQGWRSLLVAQACGSR